MATVFGNCRLALESLEYRLTPNSTLALTPQAVVTGLYREVLQRDPDAGGLANYSQAIETGWTAGQVASALFTSAEFRSDQVDGYYQSLLGRNAEVAGREGWVNLFLSGASEEDVLAGIAVSEEYFGECGNDNSTYVRSLYVRLLGRDADAEGLQSYVNLMESGVSRSIVASGIASSVEFRQIKIKVIYRVALNREADGLGLDNWTKNWDRYGGLDGVTANILGSNENLGRLAQNGGVQLPDLASAALLRQILQAPYTENAGGFVAKYNRLLQTVEARNDQGNPIVSEPGNRALWDLTRLGGATDSLPEDERRQILRRFVPVNQMIPTQNEIDLNKSLRFVLRDPVALQLYLNGGDVTHPGGTIMTGGGGKYVIDGHHRWSSIFVINPNVRISAFDLGYEQTPQDYLKMLQIGVGAELGWLPSQNVTGQNLFTIDRSTFNTKVSEFILDANNTENNQSALILQIFNSAGLANMAAIQDFLWEHVLQLRQFNQPIACATGRGFMPQPLEKNDPNETYNVINQMLSEGLLNYRSPTIPRLG